MDSLRVRWTRVGELLNVDDGVGWSQLLDRLLARHGEPQRSYHTAEHVEALLDALDSLLPEVGPTEVLAAMFHDAIYDPTSSTNEADSAALAVCELTPFGIDDAVVDAVRMLVDATAGHDPRQVTGAGEAVVGAFLDADLSILGSSADVYDAYARAIRIEYSHVSEADFRAGRAAILSTFLERDRLYFTDGAHELWDERARANLARELARLTP